ncbi:MAG: GatB/YqeY domain-containing protein [Candidatus Kapaibacterium sp.]|nr:MAG: GatB/YqeY domain-containing protein [Candidatus Kapabacteria bacterium]
MALTETISEQMKAAMKSGDKLRLETLRSLRALILEFEKSGADRAMNEEDEQKMLLSAAKKRKDAIEQFSNAGRKEAADKEAAELAIIQEFLPKQMDEAEVETAVKAIIESVGAKTPQEVGKVMGAAMKELRGKADGNLVQAVAKRLLGA